MGSVSIFRVVGPNELADIAARGSFRTVEGQLEVKQFWTTREDAERFMRLLARVDPKHRQVVEVRLAEDELTRIARLTLDSRPAYSVEDEQLDWFNEAVEIILPADGGAHA